MSRTLTIDDARQSLQAHVAAKGAEIHAKYGPKIGWTELQRLLLDHAFVRYPCEIAFDARELREGEFAYPVPKGARPEEGFRMCVHPHFAAQPERIPALVLYQLVAVNYGEFASAGDAETFGAAALGISPQAYYEMICRMADELGALPHAAAGSKEV